MRPYFYETTPLFVIVAICVLALPWLGLIALFVVLLLILPPLLLGLVYVPYRLALAVTESVQGRRASHHPQPIGGPSR